MQDEEFDWRYDVLARLSTAALITFVFSAPSLANDIPDLTVEQWREDVDALVAGLEKNHREAWNFVARERVVRLADETKQLGRVENHVMFVALQRIAAMIGDGHTFVAVSHLYSRYPVEVRSIEGSFYIVQTTSARAEMLGRKLVASTVFLLKSPSKN